jgi:hypothetical protein
VIWLIGGGITKVVAAQLEIGAGDTGIRQFWMIDASVIASISGVPQTCIARGNAATGFAAGAGAQGDGNAGNNGGAIHCASAVKAQVGAGLPEVTKLLV